MREPISPEDKELLTARLRGEAQASRPAFSEDFHERICRAIEQRKATAERPSARLRLRWRLLSVAVAVTLLVAVSLVARHLNRPPDAIPTPSETAVIDPSKNVDVPEDVEFVMEMPEATAESIGMLVDETLSAGQWAYLDHDARLLGQMLRDPLPLDTLAANDEP